MPTAASAQIVPLNTGFAPVARSVQGLSGGPVQAQQVDSSCRGYIGMQPTHSIMTRSGFGYLRMFVVSQGDTTLVVRGSNGMTYCNDDTYGLNPALDLNALPPGRYDIFVGSYSQGAQNPYVLYFTENSSVQPDTVGQLGAGAMTGNPSNATPPPNPNTQDPNGNGSGWGNGTPPPNTNNNMARPPSGGSQLRTDLPPTNGRIQIRGSLRRNEVRTARVANATNSASGLHGQGTCRGWIAERPTFLVQVTDPQPFLRFFLASAADTTLVIQYPDGHIACSDDSYGTLQPSIEGAFPAGAYYVWAGIYRSGMERPVRLSITANGGDHPGQ
jgi:hypothetical protein